MPLTYRDRGTSGTQFDIVSGIVVVGSLWKAVLSVSAGQGTYWCWTWSAGPKASQVRQGAASTIHVAKTAIEERWALLAGTAAARLRTKEYIPIYSFSSFGNIFCRTAFCVSGRVMRAKDAWGKAAEYAAMISTTTDPHERRYLTHMRDEWIEVANHLQAAEDAAAQGAKPH